MTAASKRNAWLFMLFGIGLICYGIYSFINSSSFLSSAIETDAVVSKIDIKHDSDNEARFTIYYDYSVNGRSYSTYETKSGYTKRNIGDHTTIFYDPGHPGDARFGNKEKRKPWLFSGLGLVSILIAIFSLRRIAKQEPKS